MGNQIKMLRGQVRQAVKEMFPEVLNQELVQNAFKKLNDEIKRRLDIIDERQKDIQAYMVRHSAGLPPTKIVPTDHKPLIKS